MEIGIIRSEEQYDLALAELEELVLSEPDENSEGRKRLELLGLLIEDYERREHPVALPDPVEAIKFRMEQEGLRQRDLVPYLGSRSRVSEVLRRKRPLSLSMIRALHRGLGIPARVLLQEEDPLQVNGADLDWSQFPLMEMVERNWIDATLEEIDDDPEYVMRAFLKPIGGLSRAAALYRKTDTIRSARTMDRYALSAWTARVQIRALADIHRPPTFDRVRPMLMHELVHLSLAGDGPKLAGEALQANGVYLVIEPQLSGTYLDGAALISESGQAIVGMTLRYDRIDNFWFTLMHELAHIVLHLDEEVGNFYDDLDFREPTDRREEEADELASEVLIPQADWKRSPASRLTSAEAALHLANKLDIHPAIVAGRMRHELDNYKILSQLVGYGEVRKHFTDVNWDE